MNFKRHSDATLMGMTKAELVEYIRMCEHNREVAERSLAQHIENVIDWQPVRHGHWIFKRQYHDADECNCSNCGQLMTTAHGVRMAYCPQCGFIMDGGADNNAT